MKRTKNLFLLCGLSLCTLLCAEQKRIMVMSDLHVLDTTLFDANNPAPLLNDVKLGEHSAELLDSAVSLILASKPDYVLIPGDLSYNGEKISHLYVAAKLAELEANGIDVYVVPGNHDVNNSAAKTYVSGQGQPTETITDMEFESIYGEFGYNEAVKTLDYGTDSMNYMAYLSDDIALIAVNSTVYKTNTGALTTGVLNFIKDCAQEAIQSGHNNLLLMSHHMIMNHVDDQTLLDPNHVGNQTQGYPALDEVYQTLEEAQIHAVFTGHTHINSIAHLPQQSGDLYDISTGSLCAYASPIRTCVLETSTGDMTISSSEITKYHAKEMDRDSVLAQGAIRSASQKGTSAIAAFRAKIEAIPFIGPILAKDIPNPTEAELRQIIWDNMGKDLQKALQDFSRGDEDVYCSDSTAYKNMLQATENFVLNFLGSELGAMLLAMDDQTISSFTGGLNIKQFFASLYFNFVTIDGKQVHTADASCITLSDVNVLTGAKPSGIEDIEMLKPVIKFIRDNQLLINVQGRTYTAAGQVLQ